jgi:hypothetical protein
MIAWIEENWFVLLALWLVYELTINGGIFSSTKAV